MQTLIICSSPAEAELAGSIQRYLETNCPMIAMQDDAVISCSDEVLEVVEGALSADIALLVLSPGATPGARSRTEWEPVLLELPRELGTMLAFLLARPCRFPEILRKQRFFDLSADTLNGLRKLRRWLLEQDPLRQQRDFWLPARTSEREEMPGLLAGVERRVGDQPGVAQNVPRATALAFAHAHRADFEAAFWIDCQARTQAGILGDTSHALGLKLAGTVEQNSISLQAHCEERRCLCVFDQIAPELADKVSFGGYASVILTASSEEAADTLSLADTLALFAAWRRDPLRCLRCLGDAWQHLQSLERECPPDTTSVLKSLGSFSYLLLREHERLAEAFEILELLSMHAWNNGDAAELQHWESEKRWIREAWGQSAGAPLRLGTSAEPEQIGLF